MKSDSDNERGRYDSMSKVFGRDLEAVGFSMSLTLAITAMMRQGKKLEKSGAGTIVGERQILPCATAEKLRAQGFPAILDTTGMNEDELNRYAALKGIETVLYMREEMQSDYYCTFKGRLAEQAIDLLEKAGYDVNAAREKSRKLMLEDPKSGLRFILCETGGCSHIC